MAKKEKQKEKYSDSYSSSSYSDDYSKYDVKVSEAINFKTKNDGEIIESSVEGAISVVNNGTKDRLWDIDLELSM